jgi:hypothetical protein
MEVLNAGIKGTYGKCLFFHKNSDDLTMPLNINHQSKELYYYPIDLSIHRYHHTATTTTTTTTVLDSSVGIATRYGLDGQGIESRWGRGEIFRISPDRPWGLPASYALGTGCFPGVKRPGRGVDHPPPSSANVDGRVELHLYCLYEPSWPALGWTLNLLLQLLLAGCVAHR